SACSDSALARPCGAMRSNSLVAFLGVNDADTPETKHIQTANARVSRVMESPPKVGVHPLCPAFVLGQTVCRSEGVRRSSRLRKTFRLTGLPVTTPGLARNHAICKRRIAECMAVSELFRAIVPPGLPAQNHVGGGSEQPVLILEGAHFGVVPRNGDRRRWGG